jgi:hypothetical protein
MTDISTRFQSWRRIVYVAVAILLAVELVRLGGQLQKRIAFPWDLLTCFESPHLAALAKLRAGEPLYGPPADANSEPYPPLAVAVSYTVLQPFGLELDIRGARGVAVGITLATALTAAWLVRRTLLAAGIARETANRVTPLVGAAAFLLLHKCLTSDQPHPDNVHILHAGMLLLFCVQAQTSRRTNDWIAAAMWASLGILTKQTAVLAPVAVVALLFTDRGLTTRLRWSLIALGVAAGVAVAGGLLIDPYRDFHLRKALAAHAIDWSRLRLLATDPTPLNFFPRVALAVVGGWGFLTLHREARLRNYLRAWSVVGFFEVLPAVSGFVKHGGYFNNLGIVDFWLFLIVAPALLVESLRGRATTKIVATAVCCWFVAALWPIKFAPNEHCYRLGEQLEQRVRVDVAAGRRTWLTAGLGARFRNGDLTVPRDLGINLWTLEASAFAGDSAEASTALEEGVRRRLAAGDYDRVYDVFPWDLRLREMLAGRYIATEPILGAGYSMHESYRGIQPTVNKCKVYELKPK